MEATEKLQEALYFLKKIEVLEGKARVRASEDEFERRNRRLRANLSAFILAWESIPEILHYDFAESFSLDISREERADNKEFRRLSRSLATRDSSFSEAADAYEWLRQQQRRLFESHKLLADWRHVVAHRGIVAIVRREHGKRTLQEQVVEVDMPINTGGSFGVSGSFGSGWVSSLTYDVNVERAPAEKRLYGVMKPLALTKGEMKKESYSYLRNDPERRPVVERCRNAYNDMRKLVEDAGKRVKS